MKPTALLLTSILTLSLLSASEENDKIKQEGIKYIQMLGSTLKTQLQTHMKADKSGLSSMGFCAAKAKEITKEVNKQLPKYASVRRTALKIRNENNTADPLDIKVMKAYEASIIDNRFKPNDIKVIKEGSTTRIYKPLITQGVCLKCHGSKINNEIQTIIDTNYPHDKAVDFQKGDLRGVIVSEINK